MKLSLRRAREALQQSTWTKPILRVAIAAVSVVVLACVGRSVTAGGAIPSAVASPANSEVPVQPQGPPPITPSIDASPPMPLPIHAARASPDDPVYLNEATAEDLRRLPNIGEKRALAILELRTTLGKFRHIDDLLRVKGIGRATLKKLRPLVRIARNDAGV